jgi:hypothetical protein
MKEAHRIRDLLTAPIIGRIYFIGLGILAILWAVQIFPTTWRDSALEKTASRIIRGYTYKTNDLLEFVPVIDDIERSTTCRPASMRSAAVIRLRLTEEAINAGDRSKIDKSLDDLIVSIRNSLQCAPADSFLWLVLYWAETTRHGFDSHYLDFLRLSYKLGPYEGWVALKRSQIAFTFFEHLPPAVAEQALAEFIGLVNSGFEREAAESFVGPGWRLREKILPRLKAVPMRQRTAFDNEVYQLGYDVDVPGVERPEARPWQR